MTALVLVIGLVVLVVVRRDLSDQSISRPPDGQPLPTAPPQTLPGSTAVGTSFSIVQQPWGPRGIGWTAPPDLGAGEKVPLVVLLHGLGENAELVSAHGKWADAVVRHRFIVETPLGQQNSWNAGGCCFPARTLSVDDVGFLDAVLDDAVKRPNVDPARIFLVGESNGGMMAYRYACQHADRLAGLASVAGTNVSGCQPSRPIPVFDAHGTGDQAVPYAGGVSLASVIAAGGTTFPPVEQAVADTATSMGCGSPADRELATGVSLRVWEACRDGAAVQLMTVAGGQHVWFDQEGASATELILRLFGIAG